MADFVKEMMESASSVKLTGGLVGRVCTAVLLISMSMGAVAMTSSVWWVAPLALFLMFGFAFPILWRVIGFAKENPHAAILDGAELLKYEQLTYTSKGQPEVIVAPGTLVEGYQIPESEQEEIAITANTPDSPLEEESTSNPEESG